MTNNKPLRIFLMLFCIFLLSVVFTAFDMPFGETNTTAYDLGYAVGLALRNMLKIVLTLAIARMVYLKIKTFEALG